MAWKDSSLHMRRLLVLMMVAGLATGAAEAAFGAVPVTLRTPGAEYLEVRGGSGRAVVTRRGSLSVNIGRGRLRIIDLAGGVPPNINCEERARWISATTRQIRGRNIRCLIWSGDAVAPWQVVMRGRRISASGRVKGSLTLDARDSGSVGVYRIAGGDWKQWPRRARTLSLHRK
jgi:hypothetical protein